jgi:predicted nucleotidyltransferase component of viral defense system
MNLFAAKDHENLLAPAETFDEDALRQAHGTWGGQLLRNCLALEVLAQLRGRTEDLLFKGGTLLQSRLAWPPLRASVDIDVDASDAANLPNSLPTSAQAWACSAS